MGYRQGQRVRPPASECEPAVPSNVLLCDTLLIIFIYLRAHGKDAYDQARHSFLPRR
jgi:hypothetical protein